MHQKISIEKPCKTPDNWNGTCIVLQECRPLFNLFLGSLSTEQIDFLRKSQCGSIGDNPLVCCPITFTVADLMSNLRCGLQEADKIMGGVATTIREFPWYAYDLNVISPNIETNCLRILSMW